MRGICVGCCINHTRTVVVDEPPKGLRIQGTSTCEMDNGAIQSQRSLLLWNQTRQHQVGNKKTGNPAQHVQEPRLSSSFCLLLSGTAHTCFYDQVTSANSLFW
ncbi:hypothetical protein MKX03_027663 [Papaver bracteatum]|nr:hypothetical protein MKX03_027663 [Papaver bracteatum]